MASRKAHVMFWLAYVALPLAVGLVLGGIAWAVVGHWSLLFVGLGCGVVGGIWNFVEDSIHLARMGRRKGVDWTKENPDG